MSDLDVLVALASNATVAAATADAWENVKHRFARLIGRGDLMRVQMAEQRLDETRQQLAETDSEETREAQERRWQARFADLLNEYPDLEGDLRALVEEIQAQLRAKRVVGVDYAVATGQDVSISSSEGGVAAGIIHGDVIIHDVVQTRSNRQGPLAPPIASPHSGREFRSRNAKLFISYSHRDERYREQLVTHLAGLRRQGLIADWHDRKIVPGQEWRDAIDQNLDAADCVLLLVSPDFLASDYCYSIEMQRTLEKHQEGRVLVIPVIVRPADWQHTPLGDLQALPKDAKPVVEWARRDRAWLSVTEGLRGALAQWH